MEFIDESAKQRSDGFDLLELFAMLQQEELAALRARREANQKLTRSGAQSAEQAGVVAQLRDLLAKGVAVDQVFAHERRKLEVFRAKGGQEAKILRQEIARINVKVARAVTGQQQCRERLAEELATAMGFANAAAAGGLSATALSGGWGRTGQWEASMNSLKRVKREHENGIERAGQESAPRRRSSCSSSERSTSARSIKSSKFDVMFGFGCNTGGASGGARLVREDKAKQQNGLGNCGLNTVLADALQRALKAKKPAQKWVQAAKIAVTSVNYKLSSAATADGFVPVMALYSTQRAAGHIGAVYLTPETFVHAFPEIYEVRSHSSGDLVRLRRPNNATFVTALMTQIETQACNSRHPQQTKKQRQLGRATAVAHQRLQSPEAAAGVRPSKRKRKHN